MEEPEPQVDKPARRCFSPTQRAALQFAAAHVLKLGHWRILSYIL
jgi:hypothetical protein